MEFDYMSPILICTDDFQELANYLNISIYPNNLPYHSVLVNYLFPVVLVLSTFEEYLMLPLVLDTIVYD